MMALSLDRYLTIIRPQPVGKYRRHKHLVTAMAVFCYVLGFVVNIGQALQRKNSDNGECHEHWENKTNKMIYMITIIIITYIGPCTVIMLSHIALKGQLTSLSLSQRAMNGELPLPLPFIRHPTDLPIMFLGVTTHAEKKVLCFFIIFHISN